MEKNKITYNEHNIIGVKFKLHEDVIAASNTPEVFTIIKNEVDYYVTWEEKGESKHCPYTKQEIINYLNEGLWLPIKE